MKPAFILALLLLLDSGAVAARSSLRHDALQRGNGPEPSTRLDPRLRDSH